MGKMEEIEEIEEIEVYSLCNLYQSQTFRSGIHPRAGSTVDDHTSQHIINVTMKVDYRVVRRDHPSTYYVPIYPYIRQHPGS